MFFWCPGGYSGRDDGDGDDGVVCVCVFSVSMWLLIAELLALLHISKHTSRTCKRKAFVE